MLEATRRVQRECGYFVHKQCVVGSDPPREVLSDDSRIANIAVRDHCTLRVLAFALVVVG